MISVISVRQVGCRFQPVHITTTTTIPNRQQTNRPKTLSPQRTPLSLPPTLPPVPTSPTLPIPLPNTPLILGLALQEPGVCPAQKRSNPVLKLAHLTRNPTLLSILLVHHTRHWLLSQKAFTTPCPAHSLSTDGCALGDAPGLKPLSNAVNSSIPTLSTMPSLPAPVRGGLEADRTSVVHSPPIICIPPSSSGPPRTKTKTITLLP